MSGGAKIVFQHLYGAPGGAGGGWLLLLLLLLLPGPVEGQRSTDELEVTRAALYHLRDSLPRGPAVLDPEPFCQARLIGWSCPDALRATADSLGFRLNSRVFTHVCLGGPGDCRLLGAESLLVLTAPEVERDSATLEASLWWRHGGRTQPPGHRRLRLTLLRSRAGWEVVSEDPLPEAPVPEPRRSAGAP